MPHWQTGMYLTPARLNIEPKQATEATAITGIVSTTFAAGTPVCGTTFVVPPSGLLAINVGGTITQSNNGHVTRLGWEIRTGGVVGSGTVVWAASSTRTVAAGRAVNTGAPIEASGSFRYLVGVSSELTIGDTYNIQTMHMVTGGSGSVTYRVLMVEPVQ